MPDIELTLKSVEQRSMDGMKAALIDWSKTFKAEMAQPAPAPSGPGKPAEPPLPTELEVTIDGKPVKAQLLDGKYTAKLNQAAMSAGGLAGVIESGDNFRLLNYRLGPVTSAILGTSAGLVVGSVLDKVVAPANRAGGPNWLNPVVKVGAGAAAIAFLPRFTGEKFAWFLAGSLFVQVALRHTPLATWIGRIVTTLSKAAPSLAQGVQRGDMAHPALGNNGANQAVSVMGQAFK